MPTTPLNPTSPQAIILAAGKGTRMGGDLPKVLHTVADRPIVQWVVEACKEAGVSRCVVVVGYRGDLVRQALASEKLCQFVDQGELLGTGHATRAAEPLIGNFAGDLFVLAGDGPLIRAATLRKLLETHRAHHASATLATAILDDPAGYGRMIRRADGGFQGIVEQKDATEEQKLIREVNPSYYCFRAPDLFDALGRLKNNNSQREYYLTDVPALLQQAGKAVRVVEAVPPEDVLSINTPQQLAEVDRVLRRRLAHAGRLRKEPA